MTYHQVLENQQREIVMADLRRMDCVGSVQNFSHFQFQLQHWKVVG